MCFLACVMCRAGLCSVRFLACVMCCFYAYDAGAARPRGSLRELWLASLAACELRAER